MYNQKNILYFYNEISDEKLSRNDLLPILPKLYLILNKINIDQIELIEIIDILKEFKMYNKLDSITPEAIDLIKRITCKDIIDLDGTLYFSTILKHLLLPYNLDICKNNYNLVLFLSEFEIFIELITKTINKKDINLLDKYNHELKEIIVQYKECRRIYQQYVINDVILSEMSSHFASMLYFNLDDFDYNYGIIVDIMYNIIDNYKDFIDYCCSLNIHKNYTRICNDIRNIEKEYIVSYNMLKYLYDHRKEKIKRK